MTRLNKCLSFSNHTKITCNTVVPGSTRTFLPSTKHSNLGGGPPALDRVCWFCIDPATGVVLTVVWPRLLTKLRPKMVRRNMAQHSGWRPRPFQSIPKSKKAFFGLFKSDFKVCFFLLWNFNGFCGGASEQCLKIANILQKSPSPQKNSGLLWNFGSVWQY